MVSYITRKLHRRRRSRYVRRTKQPTAYWKGEPIFEGNIALSSMHEGNYRYLTALNDVAFDQIADLIEAYC